MPTFKGIIENQIDFSQSHFQVKAEKKEDAEALVLQNESTESGFPLEKLEILVCIEELTQEQADAFEKEQPNESLGV